MQKNKVKKKYVNVTKIDTFLKMKQKFHVRIEERELTHDPNQKLYQ
jgi:hypothetical protein